MSSPTPSYSQTRSSSPRRSTPLSPIYCSCRSCWRTTLFALPFLLIIFALFGIFFIFALCAMLLLFLLHLSRWLPRVGSSHSDSASPSSGRSTSLSRSSVSWCRSCFTRLNTEAGCESHRWHRSQIEFWKQRRAFILLISGTHETLPPFKLGIIFVREPKVFAMYLVLRFAVEIFFAIVPISTFLNRHI